MASAWRRKSSTEDYLVASRSVNPWLVSLSAVSTNNSGYMFIGLIGFTWREGLSALWISLGWIVGDFISWLWVHRRVRVQSEAIGARSLPALLATDEEGELRAPISIAAALLTLLFLTTYAAAQLQAGSVTLHSLFGWPEWLGAVLGVTIVAAYCMSGGIRASIWTDAAQAVVMLGSMALLLGVCISEVGGPRALVSALGAIDPGLTAWAPASLPFGFSAYFIGFVFGGAAVIGQPHVVIRFMALDSADSIAKARRVYFVWFTLFSAAAYLVGLYARVLLPDLAAGLSPEAAVMATETALPRLSMELLSPVLIGVMLAGLFSATMSTADSQILACSAALTQDLAPAYKSSYGAAKLATLLIAAGALAIALHADQGVFALVLIAWSTLGATLGPILLVRLAGRPLPSALALAMMATGFAVVILWGRSPWSGAVFKALPGMLAPLLLYALATPFRRRARA